MIRMNAQSVARILTTTLTGLLTMGLEAATAAPAFGQAHSTFIFTGSMQTTRAFHTATLLQNGQVLVAGGVCERAQCGANAAVLASAQLYNPSTGTWTVTGSMSTPRLSHTATLLKNGEVLVTGGDNYNSGSLDSAELYNPSTGTWSTTGSMTEARYEHGAVLLQSGEVLVTGGLNSNGLIAAAELYDPTTGDFTATASMNYARGGSQLTLLQNGGALIAGGNEGFTGTIAETTGCTSELFSNGHWSLTNLAFCGVTGDTAALLPNGDVVIDIGSPSQFYDLSKNVWKPTLGQTLGGPLASLANGKVLAVAGPTAELYDPSTNEWTQSGSLKQGLFGGLTLTRLLNGQVLVAGGEIETRTSRGCITRTIISTVASAELYTP